jgi:protein AATF/BFR2
MASYHRIGEPELDHADRGKRKEGEGQGEEEEEDMEIFDDTDFYQQLLRDVIDAKSGANADWIAMQRERKATKKKQVDTKASKGRKIR